VLTGAEESDTFSGGSGNDELTGGSGPDLLDGQDGDDALRARDGQGDLARGGAGNDSAQTDAPGLDVLDAVESVDALAAPPVIAPDTKGTAARIAARRAAVQIRNGRAWTRLRVACPAAEAGGCIGTVTLVSAKPVRIGDQRVAVVLGSARYALAAGRTKRVTVRLPKGVRKLAKGRALAAVAQTVTRDAARNVATGSRAVSLRLPK
jgi:Ca2+-binding RTX toxin-like protein